MSDVIVEVFPQVTEIVVEGGLGPQGPAGPPGACARVALAADTQLDETSGTSYTNTGATGTVIATLPPSADIGAAFYQARFRLTVAQLLRVKASGADVIRYYGIASSAGGHIEIAERDACLEVEYVGGGVYLVTAALMDWSFGP